MELSSDLEYNDLGYFDSDESYASDFLEESEEENDFYKPKPVINNLKEMFLPKDVMLEILYNSEMSAYIKLCSASKEFKKLCTNDLWENKFNQYDIKIIKKPVNFNDWVQLYKDHIKNLDLYKIVDIYMKNMKSATLQSYNYQYRIRYDVIPIRLEKKDK